MTGMSDSCQLRWTFRVAIRLGVGNKRVDERPVLTWMPFHFLQSEEGARNSQGILQKGGECNW